MYVFRRFGQINRRNTAAGFNLIQHRSADAGSPCQFLEKKLLLSTHPRKVEGQDVGFFGLLALQPNSQSDI